ncbi:MAG TPA: lysophospholipid acyltransferase family protein [Nevskiaceae bacterium]|nr:lysophospholipid acyltransferase family protein [Nevskiaceae bacterium]
MSDDPAEAAAPVPLKTRLAARLLAGLMRLIFLTSRRRYTGLAHLQTAMDGGPVIVVSWHNRNILGPFGYLAHRRPGRAFTPLASASRDGTLAALAMRHLGVECIRGSSSRGGSAALRQMVKSARAGNDLGITPDGPRGPKYVVQPGVITTARLTGLPIVPMSYQARRRIELRSWDAMIVPWPFNRLHYVYGEPIRVPREADEPQMEALRQQVEQALLTIGETAGRD